MATPRPPVERRHPPDALIRAVNPVVRFLVDRGRLGNQLLILHYTGRRTGRRFDIPAGYHVIDGVVSVLTNSGWRHNFTGGKDIDITLRGERQGARAVLIDKRDTVADVYERLIGELGPSRAERRLGLRINLDRAPTRGELRDAVQRSGLSIVQIHHRADDRLL
jgi:hypothetical protein